MSVDAAIAAIAERNHGVITRDDAMRAGLSDQSIRTRILSGRWRRVGRGVYVIGGSVGTWEQRVAIACLGSPGGTASHVTACRMHRLAYLPDDGRIHVSVALTRSVRSRAAVVHATANLEPRWTTQVSQLPVTTIERSIVDLAGSIFETRLCRVVDDALDRKLTSWSSLDECLMAHARPGRRGVRILRSVLDARGSGLEATESTLERRYLLFCAERAIPLPDLQCRLTWRGRVVGRVDMMYPRARVVVELDGRRGHSQLTDQERDRIRDQEAAAAGWLTARVTWAQLHRGADSLCARLTDILRARTLPAVADG